MDKEIVIAVSASIAAYRTCDVVRELTKKSYPVSVIMTDHATHFVGKIVFEAMTGKKVWIDEFEQGMAHIDVRDRAGIFAVVPATANTIAKLAHGQADDLVGSTYLALTCPIFLAPSMNPNMYLSAPVQRNLKTLESDGVKIISPQDGEAVCGDVGMGKLAEVSQIVQTLASAYDKL